MGVHTSETEVFKFVFGRPFVKRFVLCYDRYPVLSVTLVYCSQTVGRIKMKLGMEVGLGPGDIVLDEAQLSQKEHGPQYSANVCCVQTVAHVSYC